VTWGELRPALTEIAGAQALDELELDARIDKALAEAGRSVGQDQIERERQLLIDQLSDDPNRAMRLLDELRTRRGLGPRRFDALLRRNAALRALVADSIEVTPAMEQQQFELLYGERRQARIIVLPSLFDAQRALEDLSRGTVAFNDLAVSRSTDSSAVRGGLLEPISRADATYPDGLRRALWELAPGQISRPILLDDDYAILRLERIVPADGSASFDARRHQMAQMARLAQERLAMDRLALDLVSNAQISIFDDALDSSWRMSRRSRAGAAAGPGREP
jgi:parvulin-like peptidyl-prolyl isomerase